MTGLPVSGGGTVTPAVPGISSSGTTATIRTTIPHNRSVGDIVTIVFPGVPPLRVQRHVRDHGRADVEDVPVHDREPASLATGAAARRRTSRRSSVRIGGNDSVFVGGTSQAYNNANLADRDQRDRGLRRDGHRHRRRDDRASRSPTTGPRRAWTCPNIELVDLSCGGCFALGRGDEPRRRVRLVPPELRRHALGADRERHRTTPSRRFSPRCRASARCRPCR